MRAYWDTVTAHTTKITATANITTITYNEIAIFRDDSILKNICLATPVKVKQTLPHTTIPRYLYRFYHLH